jgi:Mn2+/Fe2+ NRAMP family transporter
MFLTKPRLVARHVRSKDRKTSDYLLMIVALTGSTVSPWMQSYL